MNEELQAQGELERYNHNRWKEAVRERSERRWLDVVKEWWGVDYLGGMGIITEEMIDTGTESEVVVGGEMSHHDEVNKTDRYYHRVY